MPKYDQTYKTFLQNTTVGSLTIDPQSLVVVSPDATVKQAAELLNEKKIWAAPIFDSKVNEFIGFIDVFSIMTYLVFGKTSGNSDLSDHAIGPLKVISRGTQRMFVFSSTQNLSTLFETLAFQTPRVIVESAHKGPDPLQKHTLRIFSQTDALRLLSAHISQLGNIVDQPIDELGLVDDAPVTVTENTTALEAFRTIRLMGINAVAVVNEKGEIVANLSASDVKGLSLADRDSLKKPVLEFLKDNHPEKKLVHPITCSSKSTLKEVILQLVAAKIHRVWVVDSANKPKGVVTLSDLCRLFSS